MDFENSLENATGYILLAIDCCKDIPDLQDLKSYLDICMDEIRRIEDCKIKEVEQ